MPRNTENHTSRDGETATVTVTNLGGIDQSSVTLSPGVSILTGRNATNRTSLLSAIGSALGGSTATLKSDADEGSVTLTLNGDDYTRRFTRTAGSVTTAGTPYTDDSELVDLFACLLRENRVRQAVERGENLREILMEPVDVDRIHHEIDSLQAKRTQVTDRLEEIKQRRERLPDLEDKRSELTDSLQQLEQDLETVQARIEQADDTKAETEQAERLIDDLEERRHALAQTQDKSDHQESQLEQLRERREEVTAELAELEIPDDRLEDLGRELDRLRTRERDVENTLSDLTQIVEFNEGFLRDESAVLEDLAAEQDPTAQLDPTAQTVHCWTCGSDVDRSEIRERIEDLQEVIAKKREQRDEFRTKREAVQEQRHDLEQTASNEEALEARKAELDREIEHREEKLSTLRADADELETEVADLETAVEEAAAATDDDLAAAFQRQSELEYRRGQLESELSEVETRITEIEEALAEQEQLNDQRETLTTEIETLRSRVESLERDAVDRFNDEMAVVLDLLEYQNIARVWIERKVESTRSGEQRTFTLHVVRETTSGSAYEDSLATLSESEREVIGLVVALAGFLVHEVYETVPMILVDSLEAIDAERIAALIEYFYQYTPYLILALLPEDEQVLPEEYARIPADALSP